MTAMEAFNRLVDGEEVVVDKNNLNCIRTFYLVQHPNSTGDLVMAERRSNYEGVLFNYGFTIPNSQLKAKQELVVA